jgi:hypothetical protein
MGMAVETVKKVGGGGNAKSAADRNAGKLADESEELSRASIPTPTSSLARLT